MINAAAINAQRIQTTPADTTSVAKGPAARAADAKLEAVQKDKVTLSVLKRDFKGLSTQHKAMAIGAGVGLASGLIASIVERGASYSPTGAIIGSALFGLAVAGGGTRAVRNFTEGSWGNKIASGVALTGTTTLGVAIAKQATNASLLTKVKGGVWGMAVGMVVVGATTGLIRSLNK